MAKFDFSNSRYAKFFGSKDNANHLRNFLNTEDIIHCNYGWYLTQGHKAAKPCATNLDGTSLFEVTSRKLKAASLMDMRAPFADTLQGDKYGVEKYTGSIPDFSGEGFVEQSFERKYKEDLYEEFGDDSEIVAAYADRLQEKIDQADSTLSFLTAQVMTKGFNDYRGIGRGIQTTFNKVPIPVENMMKAGVTAENGKIWTDPDCNILKQMKEIETYWRYKWGAEGSAFKWQMTRNFFYDTFLKNKFVQDFVKQHRTLNYIATPEGYPTTLAMWNEAAKDLAAEGISPIELVEEKVHNKTNNGENTVNGWADNIVVFRPAGDAVEFQWAELVETAMFKKYGNQAITKVFAKANNGLTTIINTTLPNGNYKEWHTDILMKAVPALVEFPYHVIVDISKAYE